MAKYGRDIKLKLGGVPLLGTREKTLKYTGEAVDITDDYSNGYQELCGKDAVNAIELTVSGIEKDGFLKGRKNAGQLTGLLEIEGLDGVTQFNVVMQSLSFGVAYNDVVTYEATFKSTGNYAPPAVVHTLHFGLLVNDVGVGVVTQPQSYTDNGFSYYNYAGEFPRLPVSAHPKNNSLPLWFYIPDFVGQADQISNVQIPIRSSSPYFKPENIGMLKSIGGGVEGTQGFFIQNYWQPDGEMYIVFTGAFDNYLPLANYTVVMTDDNSNPIAQISVELGREPI